jgi:ketosteroid isomerase-like protein
LRRPQRLARCEKRGEYCSNSIITDKQLTQFIQRTEEAADAYVRGDMDDYLRLVHHARGFTLLAPYGGPATRHEDRATEIRSSAALFHSGEARLEHVETHAWGDTVVLAMIERQHGEIGDSPDQEWPLRVTHVYRRDGSDWQLVHRHADPLVRTIGLEVLASLAQHSVD